MRPLFAIRHSAALAFFGALAALSLLAPAAHASRPLLSEHALETGACIHCPAPSGAPAKPPPEGQIEGACGLAIKPSGEIYLSDYYHRVIDLYGPYSGGSPATYGSQLLLPGSNPTLGTNTLDAVCGLALDTAGNIYANEFHQRVFQVTPTETTIDTGESTGLAIDASTDRLYVDDRTYIAEYALPFAAEDKPLAKFATKPTRDYYGLAAFQGRLYVADSTDETVKVFEPASSVTTPVHTISAGFVSLTDAALAVDPSNGHLLVVDNTQPLFEHPQSRIREFGSPGEGYVNLGALPGAPVFGGPSGIAVSATGTVLVTDGNDELANVFAYGPYQAGFVPLAAPSPPSVATSSATVGSAIGARVNEAAVTATGSRPTLNHPKRRHHRRVRRHHRVGGRR